VPPASVKEDSTIRKSIFVGLFALAAFAFGSIGQACILDAGLGYSAPLPYLFPNWQKAELVTFNTTWCSATDCPGFTDATIKSVTIVNYGTAIGGPTGDITGLYMCFGCFRTNGGDCNYAQTLGYAGLWDGQAVWTWAGNLALSGDPCNAGPGGCACIFVMHLFVDIGKCPTNLATVALGPRLSPDWWNMGILDAEDCSAPWGAVSDMTKTIVYTVKLGDKQQVAPGDTVTYSIFYGKPGSSALSNVTIFDSQPAYTHWNGVANINPDPFWDPNPGPPLKLKWTISPVPANLPLWGPSSMLTFQLTVDWGNGDAFESGSGNVAAPEGFRLNNRALVEFNGPGTCATNKYLTFPTTTVVKRFLFWKLGDNDVLFAPSLGQSPDEMIYSIFVKNLSNDKTWWDVRIWDTVPPVLDTWCNNCGMEDPCYGWTMTPSGCAAASAGKTFSGANTVLTWKLDMPPGMTLELRWKAQVKQTTTDGQTAINTASILELGHTRIVDGTGHSGRVRNFTHLATIQLPTTYISYVAFAAGDGAKCPGFLIDFFPLNRKTQFELRGLQYVGGGWATDGGISNSIGTFIGDCLGGFPGGGGISGGGIAGCKSERIPAKYDPTGWQGTCPTFPFEFIYKLTSNSPVLWQLLTHISDDNQDNVTFTPSTTLTFRGLMHYMWRRTSVSQGAGYGDSLAMINTTMDAYNNQIPGLETTVHLYKWDYTSNGWLYRQSYDIADESLVYDMGTVTAEEGPWRAVSSDAALIVSQGDNNSDTLGCCCGQCADNFGALMPNRETGNVSSRNAGGPYVFYGLVQGYAQGEKVVIGNLSGGMIPSSTAKFTAYKYVPDDTVPAAPMPAMLNGSSGTWSIATSGTVSGGIASFSNPVSYGGSFNASSLAAFKVEHTTGGPIQILAGDRVYSVFSGGNVLNSSDGNQTGQEFWLHHVIGENSCNDSTDTQTLSAFCPKSGMAVRLVSQDGYSARYTSTGLDQCISFRAFTEPAAGSSRNYILTLLGGAGAGKLITMFIQCVDTEKGYTAPFLQTGTHYTIIMPPVVFANQSFWITVIVLETGGVTKCDYTGTSSFTSTDPLAKIESKGMDTYNYTWKGATDCGVKVFVNVSFSRLGNQSIVVVDTIDGSISGVAATLVIGADIKLEKRKKITVAASGDTVQFQLCWSNFSSATGFSFVITDAVPMGTTYVPEIASTMLCSWGGPAEPAITVWYSTATTTTPPGTFTSVPGTGSPLSNTRWLRWTVRDAYVNSTGCVCFKVSVN